VIYLDAAATSFHKPAGVYQAVEKTMKTCASPGRGGYGAAMEAAQAVFRCRELAGKLFSCNPEQIVITTSCTHGLNIGIRSLVKPGSRVVISGFEHNAVTRPLHALGANIQVAGRRLFDWEDTLSAFRKALDSGADAAVFTHVSNVFGYILPVEEIAALCRERGVPFILDAAQSAGHLPVSMEALGAEFIAMPGHKGLLGPQGTGLLLCRESGEPLLYGGTGSESLRPDMPDMLPERLEPGTMNVPGIAGVSQGLQYVLRHSRQIHAAEDNALKACVRMLKKRGIQVFHGEHQSGVVSCLPQKDCQEVAQQLARRGIAVRAGLHCAPLAHESGGTLETGTVRISFGWDANSRQLYALEHALSVLS